MKKSISLIISLFLMVMSTSVWAQIYTSCNMPNPCRIWYATAVTDSTGSWSVSIPVNTFSNILSVEATAVSSSAALANQAIATIVVENTTTISGMVILPTTVVVGGTSVKAAGSGLTVNVTVFGS